MSAAMSTSHAAPLALGAGFADTTLDSQAAFRSILDAFARPGRVMTLAGLQDVPADLPLAASAALLTLADYETPLWLPATVGQETRRWLAFHTGASVVENTAAAAFAVIRDDGRTPRLGDFNRGDDRYPDKSATVLVCCDALNGGRDVELAGPGIKGCSVIAPRGLAPSFWDDWMENHARFPLGVDVVLVAGPSLIALPRGISANPRAGDV